MAVDVILPALGMSQDSGKIVRWLKAEGEQVAQGEPLVEIETDKATVEIEAPTAGRLVRVAAREGDDVPVGQVIAAILAPGETSQENPQRTLEARNIPESAAQQATPGLRGSGRDAVTFPRTPAIAASSLASRIAAEHHVDLSQVKAAGSRVQKADVLAYLQNQNHATPSLNIGQTVLASPKARRLAREQGKDLAAIKGTGPGGAVLASDILAAPLLVPIAPAERIVAETFDKLAEPVSSLAVSTIWRIMAERTTQSWTSVPHFYLTREVNASRLIAWHNSLLLARGEKDVTYTDLLVKVVAAALRVHPRINATWGAGGITLMQEIHIGLAVAVEEGLVVPVVHQADTLGLRELTQQRIELVARARAGKLRPADISGGTFTISNLGMYGVDAFNAIINEPQVAILAVGRIAERVVPVNGQPAVQPMMGLTLSCDHRAVDGARGARFLDTLAELIEEPLGLLSS